ncbi:putative bifunctional diguanylate cyclase/phosphodiesterase [Pseudoduganella sp. RAF53_2]|uniref:putative bifunctional diguanylate cyclase/phosphodiesterase n=1 Tax=unclassified Pseudoduganella TaxID=2637179 RepID=UPI003F9A92FE
MMEFDYAEAILIDGCNSNIYTSMTSVWMRSPEGHLDSVSVFVTDFPPQASLRGERSITGANSLAGLLSADSFRRELERAIDSSTVEAPSSLLLISISGLDSLSESFGREHTLSVQVEAARRIRRTADRFGKVGRHGINEFLVLCESEQQNAYELSQALLGTFRECFVLNGEEVYLSASIGMCRIPSNCKDAEEIVFAAEAALRQAKKRTGGTCIQYTDEIGQAMKRKAELEHSLRKAVVRGEMELEYQPRVDVRTMKVVALEALLRWNHPKHGRISPLEFIPIAEERGLIFDIGKWVLETACKKASELAVELEEPVRVSVNVSAHQLKDNRFSDVIVEALEQSQLPPNLLELELTESVLVEDCDRCADVLRGLKALGLSLSVDDFGTGYSSLAYLQFFPFDTIKLDKTFINNTNATVDNRKLVRALIDMSHALDLSVVAEGVECKETLAFLAANNCDEVQGYLMSRPLNAKALQEFLQTSRKHEINANWSV